MAGSVSLAKRLTLDEIRYRRAALDALSSGFS